MRHGAVANYLMVQALHLCASLWELVPYALSNFGQSSQVKIATLEHILPVEQHVRAVVNDVLAHSGLNHGNIIHKPRLATVCTARGVPEVREVMEEGCERNTVAPALDNVLDAGSRLQKTRVPRIGLFQMQASHWRGRQSSSTREECISSRRYTRRGGSRSNYNYLTGSGGRFFGP